MPTDPKRVLVTGGAGFLGSHLCDRLLADGHEVLCLDNLSSGSRSNVAHLAANPRFRFIQHDVTIPLDVEVDEIYNLACPASPVQYQRDPIGTTRTSVLGALAVLELARRTHAQVMQASTSEVYGDPDESPQREEYWGRVNPIGVRACYDEGKRCAETLFFDYHRQYHVKIKVVRIFNTYGPRMRPDDGRVVSNFIVQALNGHNITLYGDGTQTRSFCFVSDIVHALVAMMESPDEVTGPINLGNPDEVTIEQLALTVLDLVGGKSRLVFRPLPQDDPRQRRPDVGRAESLLGWHPQVALDAGLRVTVQYFRQRLAAVRS